jgi:hypothetical protein
MYAVDTTVIYFLKENMHSHKSRDMYVKVVSTHKRNRRDDINTPIHLQQLIKHNIFTLMVSRFCMQNVPIEEELPTLNTLHAC